MRALLFLPALLANTLFGQSDTKIPDQLRPSQKQTVLLDVTGRGQQIYSCQAAGAAFAWKLKAPDAELLDGTRVIGKHFAGPTWRLDDGSEIKGRLDESLPARDPSSIAWLRLTVISHSGEGKLSNVETVLRVDTKGGKAPPGGCDAQHENAELPVAYEAKYLFYGQRH